MAEALMIALVRKGMGRQEAHELSRKVAMRAQERDEQMLDSALQNETIKKLFAKDELKGILDPLSYLGDSARRCDAVIKEAARVLGEKL